MFDGRPEHNVLMRGHLVQKTIDEIKLETRRVPPDRFLKWRKGDLVWVRETWSIRGCGKRLSIAPEAWPDGWPVDRLVYQVDEDIPVFSKRVSIHMPKWAARLWLELTEDVAVERVQDITDRDVIAEGLTHAHFGLHRCDPNSADCRVAAQDAILDFAGLWDDINASRGYSWEQNPEVAVIRYRVVSKTGRPG